MLIEPSSERSSIKATKFALRLRFVRNGPNQYVDKGFSVSILAHQAKPSLFPNFLINVPGELGLLFLLNSIQFFSKSSINI